MRSFPSRRNIVEEAENSSFPSRTSRSSAEPMKRVCGLNSFTMAKPDIRAIVGQQPEKTGIEMHQLISDLFPMCRSITGNGVRQTLRRMQQDVPLQIMRFRRGQRSLIGRSLVNGMCKMRTLKSSCKKVIDFRRSNLHLPDYSTPIRQTMSLSELKPHLFSIPSILNGFRTAHLITRTTGGSV